jgi:hypothetical protein
MKADVKTLNNLHDAVAKKYLDMLESEEPMQPAVLSAINKFLKDNDITATEVDSDPMSNLVDQFMAGVKDNAEQTRD